jgi:coenzyme F420-0:L-glutamate ligase
MRVRSIRTRVFKEHESLEAFVIRYIPRVRERSIIVVTSKIVALSEGRTARAEDKEKLVVAESEWTLKTKRGRLTLKDGILMWNAGIDSSNAGAGRIVLLPKDSFRSAATLAAKLKKRYKVRSLGVVITDSRLMPLRTGVVGIALGHAGFKGLKDYRGKTDLFGDIYHVTRVDVADSLATAAVLLMGEGDERQPLAIIESAPVEFTNKVKRNELCIPLADDMYLPLFKRIPRKH